jgi:hypothetical protein
MGKLAPQLGVFLIGFLFAMGLGLGGMTDPSKVIAFLNIAGDWDPSLAFVMGGAIAVHVVLYRLILRRPSPVYGARFQVPTRRDFTPRLVVGASLFGFGWALGGYCPGPSIVSVASLAPSALVFVLAMAVGMYGYTLFDAQATRARVSGAGEQHPSV